MAASLRKLTGMPVLKAIAGACIAATAMVGALHAQSDLRSAMTAARDSVVMVRAAECANGANRVGTGFLWQNSRTIVTARHVVAGCDRISVLFTETGQSHRAAPQRELRRQDLVSLTLDSPAAAEPLRAGQGLPAVSSRLAALGYAYGAPTLDSKVLQVTLANSPPGSKLADMLGDGLRQTLQRSGELDIDTLILRLDGNLLPGLSGAPLIGIDGAVYGIGSGGIQEGAGGVVWAVRSRYLAELGTAAQVATIAAIPRSSGLSFALQTDQQEVTAVKCGVSEFRRSRTAALDTLYFGSDDQLGLLQLAATFGLAEDILEKMQFDIWVDSYSGATIAVPAGSSLDRVDETGCQVGVGSGIEMSVVTAPVASDFEAQTISNYFEEAVKISSGMALAADPSFTYFGPRLRDIDGFVVRRSAFGGAFPTLQAGKARFDYTFVTHMARGDRYVGVAASRRDFVLDFQKAQFCQLSPGAAGCEAMRQRFVPWAKAALAVHLATMPPI